MGQQVSLSQHSKQQGHRPGSTSYFTMGDVMDSDGTVQTAGDTAPERRAEASAPFAASCKQVSSPSPGREPSHGIHTVVTLTYLIAYVTS